MIKARNFDAEIMERVIALAGRGSYTTGSNPRVGSIIAKGGEVLAEGWHRKPGEAHAEIAALEKSGDRARGSDLYVNLEPCVNFGLTPPCVPALIAAGIRRVVIAMKDPNPTVSGRGISALEAAGIDVTVGVGEKSARELNQGFVMRMTTGRPFVRLKLAATIDGRTAAPNGSSQWITSQEARQDVHHWRALSDAVVTGIGTIESDNPRLNARVDAEVMQPLRVVVDSDGRLDDDVSLFSVEGPILLVTSRDMEDAKSRLDDSVELIKLRGENERVDLVALVIELGNRGKNEVLIEAGAKLAGAFVEAGLVDEYLVYFAPDLLGDHGRGMFVLPDIDELNNRVTLEILEIRRLGRDLCLRLRAVDRI